MNKIDSLKKFRAAKYGLFIHFGLYSLLGGEYQGQKSRGLAEWIQLNENIPQAEYEELAQKFRAENFSADWICSKARSWGMRYLCFTAKHHDGFALYNSQVDDYNSVAKTLAQRDFVKELAEACKKYDLAFCLYYSQAQDWHHPDGYRAYRDNSKRKFELYFREKCLPQIKELLTNYGPISMIWFDTPMGMTYKQSSELVALVNSLQPQCLINSRIGKNLGDYITTQDNRIPAYPIEEAFEVPASLNNSWGYRKDDCAWRSETSVIKDFLKVISRGGNYLLNIGPDGSGKVPPPALKVLDSIGQWISKTEEAIYNTKTLPLYVYETEDIYFTQRDYKIFIHITNIDQYLGQELALPHITNRVNKAYWLNSNTTENALRISKTLEGNPYWGIKLPQSCSSADVLTLCVETQEKDFLQEDLSI